MKISPVTAKAEIVNAEEIRQARRIIVIILFSFTPSHKQNDLREIIPAQVAAIYFLFLLSPSSSGKLLRIFFAIMKLYTTQAIRIPSPV